MRQYKSANITGIVSCVRSIEVNNLLYRQEIVFTPSGQIWTSFTLENQPALYRLTTNIFNSIQLLDEQVSKLEEKGYAINWSLGWSPECRKISNLQIEDYVYFPCLQGCKD